MDGNTFDTRDGTRIRLYSIDAPGYPKGCMLKRAKERMSELTLGKEVVLEIVSDDRFGKKSPGDDERRYSFEHRDGRGGTGCYRFYL